MNKDELAVECKRREIVATEKSRDSTLPRYRYYYSGKANAYAEIWRLVVSKEELCRWRGATEG